MKIVFENDNIKVYLNKIYLKQLDINNRIVLEEYLREIFLKLRNNYQIKLNGYYGLKILYDKFYGLELVFNKYSFEYIDLFESQVDLDLTIDKTNFFLYEIEDPFIIDNKLLPKIIIYMYNDKIYLKLRSDISTLEMGRLLEFSNLISGNKVDLIINKGKKVFI